MKTTITFLLLAIHFSSSSALGEELILKGRLILQDGKGGWESSTPAPHSKIKNGYTIGFALFDDGNIAEKKYIFAQNNRETDGNLSGFSLFTFKEGDSLLLEFEASWTEDGMSGKYLSIIEGTGKFVGVTGVGSFVGVAGPWYETIMADFYLRLKTVEQ